MERMSGSESYHSFSDRHRVRLSSQGDFALETLEALLLLPDGRCLLIAPCRSSELFRFAPPVPPRAQPEPEPPDGKAENVGREIVGTWLAFVVMADAAARVPS